LPYGINTVSLFAYIFLVMLPVKLAAISSGASGEQAAELAWQQVGGLLLVPVLIEFIGAPPRAPMQHSFHFGRYCNHFYCHWFSISYLCHP